MSLYQVIGTFLGTLIGLYLYNRWFNNKNGDGNEKCNHLYETLEQYRHEIYSLEIVNSHYKQMSMEFVSDFVKLVAYHYGKLEPYSNDTMNYEYIGQLKISYEESNNLYDLMSEAYRSETLTVDYNGMTLTIYQICYSVVLILQGKSFNDAIAEASGYFTSEHGSCKIATCY